MIDRSEDFRRRLLATFRVEANEHIASIAAELDAVAADPAGPDLAVRLETLFRIVHTLKGAARSVGESGVEDLSHRCEALLRDLTQGRRTFDPALLGVLMEASDNLAAAVEGSQRREPPGTEPRNAGGSIRVDIGRLDRLLVIAEELLVPKLAAAERARAARALGGAVAELRGRLRRDGQRAASGTGLDESLRRVEGDARRLAEALADDSATVRTLVDELLEETRRARLCAAATILEAFPRMVRDLAGETGKEVAWQAVGTDVEIDRKILDAIKHPLIHMVRNAVSHGIEAPEARAAAGKPRRGRITLTVQPLDGGRVALELSDDGCGLDLQAILRAALRSRLLTPDQAGGLSEAELADLAFHAGVSTSPVITTISGHGRGLAIVREAVERIDGQVAVRSAPGAGTTIRLELPTSVATCRALIVRVGRTVCAWPVTSIDATIGVPRHDMAAVLERGTLAHAQEMLPAAHLAAVLGVAADADDTRRLMPCLIAHAGRRRGALLIDEVIGDSEILLKELRPPLRRVRNVAMAGLRGTGDLVLVLRPSDVLASMREPTGAPGRAAETAVPRARRILVVDDSITTRSMERNLFEAAGYAVRVAVDGLDAWGMLRNEDFDLVVSDIDMPRMDGFELTTRIREDPRLADLPVVLVTALDSREDKERGVRVGANAYVLKSAFEESNLLEIVGRLV
ncbi:hybrid sensor histidine kinase/response regulator [Azospirillum sp.]|uniref:hybrid sensor histidine kinase/response regulator n=1 Tax=Azospirillum sp. TaxID=34012 RepID=UPI003D730859